MLPYMFPFSDCPCPWGGRKVEAEGHTNLEGEAALAIGRVVNLQRDSLQRRGNSQVGCPASAAGRCVTLFTKDTQLNITALLLACPGIP